MQAYGLLDKSGHLTDTGNFLFSLVGKDQELHHEFARHILLHLHGLTLVQCVLDIQTSGESVDLLKLRTWLEERGVHFPRGGKHPSSMRLWLEKAGVFKTGWQVDERKLKLLAGIDSDELDILAGFTPEQKAYLKTLANLNDGEGHLSNDIERMATANIRDQIQRKEPSKTNSISPRKEWLYHFNKGHKIKREGSKTICCYTYKQACFGYCDSSFESTR